MVTLITSEEQLSTAVGPYSALQLLAPEIRHTVATIDKKCFRSSVLRETKDQCLVPNCQLRFQMGCLPRCLRLACKSEERVGLTVGSDTYAPVHEIRSEMFLERRRSGHQDLLAVIRYIAEHSRELMRHPVQRVRP